MQEKISPNIDLRSALMMIALSAIFGSSFFFAEIALKEVPPLTITLHRVFWAVPLLLVVIWWKNIEIPKSAKVWFASFVMGALNNALPFSLIFWGQVTIESGLAAILNGTSAVFGAVVAGIFLADEPLTMRKIIGAIFGLLGVAVIMGLDVLTGLDLRDLAQLAILGAALSYAFAGVWGKRNLGNYSPIMNSMGMLVGSVILMIPISIYFDGFPQFSLSLDVWAALITIASLCTAFAYLLYFAILARAGSANLMLVTLLVPLFAVGLGVVFLGERLGIEAWIGFAFIACGLIITDGRALKYLLSIVVR